MSIFPFKFELELGQKARAIGIPSQIRFYFFFPPPTPPSLPFLAAGPPFAPFAGSSYKRDKENPIKDQKFRNCKIVKSVEIFFILHKALKYLLFHQLALRFTPTVDDLTVVGPKKDSKRPWLALPLAPLICRHEEKITKKKNLEKTKAARR